MLCHDIIIAREQKYTQPLRKNHLALATIAASWCDSPIGPESDAASPADVDYALTAIAWLSCYHIS